MPLVDLDDPEELRARWTALAAVAHATGFDRRWYADEDGYHHQDETGSVLRMQRLEDGRAVLFGFQTQHSQTRRADLLAGSPDWIGQPEVRRRQTAGELGFVYGAFNGTWARAAYPGDPWQPAEDGFTQIGQWITSDADAAAEMIEWVAEWADYLGGLDELQPFGVQLIQTAGSSGISLEALQAFFDHFEIDARSPVQPDLPSGVVAAEDFTRNFAVAESFADDPDTAEVSVVEDVVIGASDGPAPVDEEDEQSFIVPPGISPFTGQPIDEAPLVPSYEQPVHEQPVQEEPAFEGPAVYQQVAYRPEAPAEYGVTGKKQGWLRRRKHENAPEHPAGFGGEGGGAAGGAAGGPAPGTYLPDDVSGGGLPAYGGGLPSSEPPRVGGGVHEGEDFYASLFADGPSAASYQQDAAEQDWETAEQAGWSEQEATSEYNPFADETAAPEPEPEREWVGGAWINGQWVEDAANYHPQPATSSDDDEAPTAEIAAVPDTDPQAAQSPFAPATPDRGQSPFATTPAQAQSDTAQHEAGVTPDADVVRGEAGVARFEGDVARGGAGVARGQAAGAWDEAGAPRDQADASRDEPGGAWSEAGVAPGEAGVARGDVDSFEDDDEEELASFTGPSPFAPVGAGEPEHDQTAEVPAVRVDELDDQTAEVPAVSAELPEAPVEAKAQVEPHPQPQPWPQPQPEPWPQPEPHPAPWPQPDPQPSPTPDPFPRPEPHPEPAPSPTPDPQPHPDPDPDREPWPAPEPEPLTPEPDPTPAPQPEPDPDQGPWPTPDPNPNQWTHPHTEPHPIPGHQPQPAPGPQHNPNHWPPPEPAAQHEPDQWPHPEPASQPGREHERWGEPAAEAVQYQQSEHENGSWQHPDPEDDRWAQAEPAQMQEGWTQAEAESAPHTPEPHASAPQASTPDVSGSDVSRAEVWGGSADRGWQAEEAGAYSVPVADADAPTGEIPVVEDDVAAGPGPIVNAPEASAASGLVDDEAPTGPMPVVNADARSEDDDAPAGQVPVGHANGFTRGEPGGRVLRGDGDDAPGGSVPVGHPNGFSGVDDDDVPTGSVPVVQGSGFPGDVPAESVAFAGDNGFSDDDTPTGAVPVVGAEQDADDDTQTGVVPVAGADGLPESDGVGADLGVPAARVIERMSIPGLALAGSDGPAIELVPGSIEEALRAEVERPRPRPQESVAFEALHAWCRARTAIVPSGFTIQVQVLDPAAPSYRFDLEPPDVDDPEFAADKLSGLLGDLWVTEAESELGGWLFARIDAAGRTMRVDRWYDRVPDWWDNPVEPRLDVNGLVRRLYGRGPQWQPSYLERLYTTAR
ncbi:hypothetical protein [Kribbella capetownensis]|uniref:hypothetical protein n=1 Tax=Kribbella capetownensis TaxID=1572659 RepID=UPI0013F43C29|nr:hypothetical protein [Kribbella capetownensis]